MGAVRDREFLNTKHRSAIYLANIRQINFGQASTRERTALSPPVAPVLSAPSRSPAALPQAFHKAINARPLMKIHGEYRQKISTGFASSRQFWCLTFLKEPIELGSGCRSLGLRNYEDGGYPQVRVFHLQDTIIQFISVLQFTFSALDPYSPLHDPLINSCASSYHDAWRVAPWQRCTSRGVHFWFRESFGSAVTDVERSRGVGHKLGSLLACRERFGCATSLGTIL